MNFPNLSTITSIRRQGNFYALQNASNATPENIFRFQKPPLIKPKSQVKISNPFFYSFVDQPRYQHLQYHNTTIPASIFIFFFFFSFLTLSSKLELSFVPRSLENSFGSDDNRFHIRHFEADDVSRHGCPTVPHPVFHHRLLELPRNFATLATTNLSAAFATATAAATTVATEL